MHLNWSYANLAEEINVLAELLLQGISEDIVDVASKFAAVI